MGKIITPSITSFPIGKLVITSGAERMISSHGYVVEIIARLMGRHMRGDWGDLCAEDVRENNRALRVGNRLLSAYSVSGEKVWIITEADRSVTTILLPEEY